MAVSSGPQAIVDGQTVQLQPPQQSGIYYDRVSIWNSSPFLGTIQSGVDQYLLTPFTANLYAVPATGALISAAFASVPGAATGGTSFITEIWYLPTDDVTERFPVGLTVYIPAPSTTPKTGQQAITGTGVIQIGGKGVGRSSITVYNPTGNSGAYYLGWSNAVTTATGYQLDPGYPVSFGGQAPLYGVAAGALTKNISWEDE